MALAVERFHGIGPATAAKMQRLGIHTGADLRAQPLAFLQQQFGKAGPHYYWISRGIDHRPVRPDRIRKSLGVETTFAQDLLRFEEAAAALGPILDKLWRQAEAGGIRGRTVTLKVKFADFTLHTRSRTQPHQLASRGELEALSLALLGPVCPPPKGIRLLGVTLSGLNTEEGAAPQLSLAV